MPIKTQQDEQLKLDLTPMIDVVFLLIIFFMVATKFSEIERSIEVNTPMIRHANATTVVNTKRTIVIQRDGTLLLDSEAVSLEELLQQLILAKKLSNAISVTIRCDGERNFHTFAEVLGACTESGIQNVNIAVRPGSGNSLR